MTPEQYKGVISMVLSEHGIADPAVADDIIRSMKIAQVLAVTADMPKPVLIQTNTRAVTPDKVVTMPVPSPVKRATIISEVPPVVGADFSVGDDDDFPDEVKDQWEKRPGDGTGPNRLQQYLEKILPLSVRVKIDGIEEPIELKRGISSPGAPMQFVVVNYGQPGDPVCPRVTVMTTTPKEKIVADSILEEIVDAAGMMYRKEKPVVQSRTPTPNPPPTEEDFRKLSIDADSVSGADAMEARKDAAAWASNRGSQWR